MDDDSNRLYLGHLPQSATEDDVLKHLDGFGTVTHIRVFPGYGWVTFSSAKDAQNVVNTFAQRRFMDADVNIEYAKPYKGGKSSYTKRSPSLPPRREARDRVEFEKPHEKYPVIVDNLNPLTCWQELKDFGRLAGGAPTYCTLDKSKRGRGYLEYQNLREAELSARKLDGMVLHGHTINVVVHEYPKKDITHRFSRDRSRSPVRLPRQYSDHKDRYQYERNQSASGVGPARTSYNSGANNQHHDRFRTAGNNWSSSRRSTSDDNRQRVQRSDLEWDNRDAYSRSSYDNKPYNTSATYRDQSYAGSRGRDEHRSRERYTRWEGSSAKHEDSTPAAPVGWSAPLQLAREVVHAAPATVVPPPEIKKEEDKPDELFSSYAGLAEMNRIAMEWLKTQNGGTKNSAQ